MNKIILSLLLLLSTIQISFGLSVPHHASVLINGSTTERSIESTSPSIDRLQSNKDGKKCKLVAKVKKFINGKDNPKFSRISYIILGVLSLGFIAIGVLTDWKGKNWKIALAVLILSIVVVSILLSAVGTVLPFLLLLASPIYAYLQMKKYYS
jgi:hypothetical protein